MTKEAEERLLGANTVPLAVETEEQAQQAGAGGKSSP